MRIKMNFGWFNKSISLLWLTSVILMAKAKQCGESDFVSPYCTKTHGLIYIEHGNALEMYCILSDCIKFSTGNDNISNNLYFTRNGELLPNNTIEILNSTAIRLRIDKPPKAESFYACKLQNYYQPICWNVVIVQSKPPHVADFVCNNYNYENFVCTWTRPESSLEITYDITYTYMNADNQYEQHKCPNLVFHKDNKKVSCLWTITLDPRLNYMQQPLHFQLRMTNAVGTTEVNKTITHLQYAFSFAPKSSIRTETRELNYGYPVLDSSFKVICYIDSTSWKREGLEKFSPEDIDPQLCTHIVYAYAILDEERMTLKPDDSFSNNEKKFYKKVTAYKAKGVKVVLGLAGWNDSIKEKYSVLVNNPLARQHFITNAIAYIEKSNFDGLELAWLYPKCWQGYCNKGPDSDKPNFAIFVKELSEAFSAKNLLLSAQVSRRRIEADIAYDIPTLSHYLDWITITSYNYQGPWNGLTGHLASLYVPEISTDSELNANFTINYWIERGADRRKLVMGMPTFGQLFALVDNLKNGLHAHTNGGGPYSFFKICKTVTEEWTIVQDYKQRRGPYAYHKKQWISYDDIGIVQLKSEYIKNMNLGGAMIWSLDVDDFSNICGCGSYPLLKTVNWVLRNYRGFIPSCRFPLLQMQQEPVLNAIPV